jgi:hypothetical protein
VGSALASGSPRATRLVDAPPSFSDIYLAFLFGVFAAVFMVAIAETARHIEQFEQYQVEIRKKWGDVI